MKKKVIKTESNNHPNEKISEHMFRYHSRTEVYANKSLDITELSEILLKEEVKR